ncbi:hypothetical protein HDV01_003930 [Terramyces sp. JEL0728]|nr:hypothetical protein HDV01_003930 [Terramyces sp. JEL0728]
MKLKKNYNPCTNCRKRKIKCGGERPGCQKCKLSRKPLVCEYEDYIFNENEDSGHTSVDIDANMTVDPSLADNYAFGPFDFPPQPLQFEPSIFFNSSNVITDPNVSFAEYTNPNAILDSIDLSLSFLSKCCSPSLDLDKKLELVYNTKLKIKNYEEYDNNEELCDDFRAFIMYSVLLYGLGNAQEALVIFSDTYMLAVRYGLFHRENASKQVSMDDLVKLVEKVNIKANTVFPVGEQEKVERFIVYVLILYNDTYISMISGDNFIVDDSLYLDYLKSRPLSITTLVPDDAATPMPSFYNPETSPIWYGTRWQYIYDELLSEALGPKSIHVFNYFLSQYKRVLLYRRIISFSRRQKVSGIAAKGVEERQELHNELLVYLEKADKIEPIFKTLKVDADIDTYVGHVPLKYGIYYLYLTNLTFFSYIHISGIQKNDETPYKFSLNSDETITTYQVFKNIMNCLLKCITFLEKPFKSVLNEKVPPNPHLTDTTTAFLIYCISTSCIITLKEEDLQSAIEGVETIILPCLERIGSVWPMTLMYYNQLKKVAEMNK